MPMALTARLLASKALVLRLLLARKERATGLLVINLGVDFPCSPVAGRFWRRRKMAAGGSSGRASDRPTAVAVRQNLSMMTIGRYLDTRRSF